MQNVHCQLKRFVCFFVYTYVSTEKNFTVWWLNCKIPVEKFPNYIICGIAEEKKVGKGFLFSRPMVL